VIRRDKTREIPLPFAPPGKEVEVIRIVGGEGMKHRLMNLAIHPGSRIKLLSAFGRGRLVVQTGETRIALGRGISYHIMVNNDDN